MDGTIWQGSRLLDGAKELFVFLEKIDIPYLAATNNTYSPGQYRQMFKRFGIAIEEKHIFTCTVTTGMYLEEEYPGGGRAYVIGKPALAEAVEGAGFTLLPDRVPDPPADVVIVGGTFELRYDQLKYAALHLQAGARLVGSNPDMLIPSEEGLVPEAGTTIAALEAATGAKATILGKPEAYFFSEAVRKMGSRPSETAILGDRLETDIAGAKRAGLSGILVTTGVDNETAIHRTGIRPDAVYHSLVDFLESWSKSIG